MGFAELGFQFGPARLHLTGDGVHQPGAIASHRVKISGSVARPGNGQGPTGEEAAVAAPVETPVQTGMNSFVAQAV
jgi:hypothetical protein